MPTELWCFSWAEEAAKQHECPPMLQLIRTTEHHRRIEVSATMTEQLAQGRPSPYWNSCDFPQCDSPKSLMLRFQLWDYVFKLRAKDGGSGRDYVWQAVDKLGDTIWPGATNSADKMARHMIIGSFFHSPPVKIAYGHFKDDAGQASIKYNRKHLRETICQVTPFVEQLLEANDRTGSHDTMCWYLGQNFDEHVHGRTLGDVVVRFMLFCDRWRRQSPGRNRTWDFGPTQVVCDVLGALLLALRTLDSYQLIQRVPLGNAEARNRCWDRWIAEYPLSAMSQNPYGGDSFVMRSASRPNGAPGRSEATVLEEVGYLGGVGTYEPAVRRKATRWGAHEAMYSEL